MLDGDWYVLNGQKVWTSMAHVADWGFFLVRTDPAAAKHKGITFMLVDMKSPGITIRPLRQITGEAEFNEVFLENVRVPASNVVGKVNEGWGVAITTLAYERDVLTMIRHISLRTALERLMALAKRTKRNGHPAAAGAGDPPEARRADGRRAVPPAQRLPQPHPDPPGRRRPGPEGSTSKLFWSQVDQDLAEIATEVIGPYSQIAAPSALGARRGPVGVLRAPRPRQRHPRRHHRDPPQYPRRARAGPAQGLKGPRRGPANVYYSPGGSHPMSTKTDELVYEVKDKIATITLNRPDKMNAFTGPMIDAWAGSLQEAQRDPDVNVVIVTGSGKAFCSGGDVARMGDGRPSPLDHKNGLWENIHRVPKALEAMDKPVIAMVNGVAVGAGMGMCVMCDMRVAADTARFSTGYVRVGLVPGDGDTYFLPRLTGTAKALELLWTADFIEAPEALNLGIVNRVVPAAELREATYALAAQIASGPQVPIRMIKRLVYQSMRLDLRTHLDLVSSHMAVVRETSDHKEGVQAFKDKRKPNFTGR